MEYKTLADQYIQYMIDYEQEAFTKMVADKFKEEIFNWGQERYDESQQAMS